jgi:hypothetical protein
VKARSFDGITVNADYVLLGLPNDAERQYTAAVALQQRIGRTPIIRSTTLGERTMAFTVVAAPQVTATDPQHVAFAEYVHWLFRAGGGLRALIARRDSGDVDTDMFVWVEVTDFGPDPSNPSIFNGTFTAPDGYWHSLTPVTDTTSPLAVLGNAEARPVVTLTGADATRSRYTISDRTGFGIGGWLVGVAWANPQVNTWVWANGVSIPFIVSDGRLWFRVDITTEGPTLVDVYYVASATNTVTAGRLDDAGTTLDAALAARTSVTADATTAGANAIAASLTWHPGITSAHHQGTPYTFGLVAEDQVAIYDREATGERRQLADDADSFVFTTSAEVSDIGAFDITVASGIRLPDADGSESDDSSRSIQTQPDRPAYLRVRVGIGGEHTDLFEEWREFRDGIESSNELNDLSEYQMDWTYGGSTGEGYGRSVDTYIEWNEEMGENETYYRLYSAITSASIANGIAGAVEDATVTLTESEGGYTYLVTFAEGSFADIALPFIGFSHQGDVAALAEQAWVDADGNVITSEDNGGTIDPSNGRVRVVLRYRVRDDESWYTAWSQVVDGNLIASAQAITVPTQSFPNGAVQVAIGLESVANGKTSIDWGVLTVTSSPVLTFMAGKPPLVSAPSTDTALYLDGSLRVDTDADGAPESTITCIGVFCDDGVALDCDELWIEGDGGIGPVYGQFQFQQPNAWIVLPPGNEIAFTLTGNLAAAEFAYSERWAF